MIESRKLANGGDPDKSYTAKLFAKGDDAILKKIGEEATETVMAAKDARAPAATAARCCTKWPTCGSIRWCCWPSSISSRSRCSTSWRGAKACPASTKKPRARNNPLHGVVVENCLFCKIAEKKIPSSIVYEDEDLLAFKDINPAAPVHLLLIPKKHFSTLSDCSANEAPLLGKMLALAPRLAEEAGCAVRL
jgi:hypothetical protein